MERELDTMNIQVGAGKPNYGIRCKDWSLDYDHYMQLPQSMGYATGIEYDALNAANMGC